MGEAITQIGRYEISRQLVDTALASVYDAFDPVERKPVAIRVPRTTQIRGIDSLSVGLKHPGLMTVLSYEENQGAGFAVLEPFDGKPLESRMTADAAMPPAEALALLRQIASALDYAHAHGSIHGSLNPSGILLNDQHEIKVLDVGPAGGAGGGFSAEQLLQAVHYLSPECIRDLPMDGRSDQFSLAVLAHRMITGTLPFPGTPIGVLFRIAYQGLERDGMRDLPAVAQAVLQRSLSKTADRRYATCTEMVDALEEAVLRRTAAAPTRFAEAARPATGLGQLMPPVHTPMSTKRPVISPEEGTQQASWLARHAAVKYFGLTFAICVLILGAAVYFLLPKSPSNSSGQSSPSPNSVPVVSQPAIAPPVPSEPQIKREAAGKSRGKSNPKKKTEPELELKPVEPKVIRQ